MDGMAHHLEPVVQAARKYPDSFLAGRLDLAEEGPLAARLRLGRPRMQRLLLRRPPRRPAAIAALIGVSSSALASALRNRGLLADLHPG